MAASRLAKSIWILVPLILAGCVSAAAAEIDSAPMTAAEPNEVAQLSGAQVTLTAPYNMTSWGEHDAEQVRFELPLLYLRRQGEAAAEAERTLQLSLTGLPGGNQVWLEAQSYHVDVSTGNPHTLATPFSLPDHACTPETPCTLQWTVDAVTTPSDFYSLRLKDDAGKLLWAGLKPQRPDLVILDTWDVDLGADSAKAYRARVYYATLFPYARGETDSGQSLAPSEVTAFIGGTFAPLIQDTWHTQVEVWGLGQPFHPDWDRDGMIEIIVNAPPFALFDGAGTHAAAFMVDGRLFPERQLWYRSSLDNFAVYATLEEAYRAAFAHEFFHLLQWNTRLAAGSPIGGWRNLFVEAQACAAVTIQYPELELGSLNGEYVRAARRFLLERQNTSYRELEAQPANRYDAAPYWRFLYETYGSVGIFDGALAEMARYLAGHANADVVRSIKPVLDATFARYDGPFHSFEESLIAFARANYALRLENGRCTTLDFSACGGFYYDPNHMYVDPPLEALLDYDGTGVTHNGAIPSSYGADFIEVRLDPTTRGQPLVIRFQSEGEVARFNVRVWQLAPGALKHRAVTQQPAVMTQTADGAHVYTVSSLDLDTYDRLALIITRLDSEESIDPMGGYRIALGTDG